MSSPTENASRSWPLITTCLVASNVIVYFASVINHTPPESMGLSTVFFAFAWEQGFFTFLLSLKAFLLHGFFHENLGHLIPNMLFLVALGPIVEKKLGSRDFFYLYFLGMLVSGITALVLNPYSDQALMNGATFPSLIGASGAISAVIGAVLFTSPRTVVGVIPAITGYTREHYLEAWFVSSFFILEQLLVVKSVPNGSAAVHIAGLIAGPAFILGLKAYKSWKDSNSTSNSSS